MMGDCGCTMENTPMHWVVSTASMPSTPCCGTRPSGGNEEHWLSSRRHPEQLWAALPRSSHAGGPRRQRTLLH